jgi:aerobic carbon-monoxide dehydrogenase medium subunit
MIPASFQYHAARSVDDALQLLAKYGDGAKLLAGGHSLIPALKLRLQSVEHLIDLGKIAGLDSVREAGGKIAIGALTTHHVVESSEVVRKRCPLLAECASTIGDVQVRNRGTIGGSLSHADPAADYPAAILALGAEIEATSAKGQRTIAAADFFVDMMMTALEPGEIVTAVRVPLQTAGTGGAYLKVLQPASGFAIVGVAALVTLDGQGKCSRVRIGVTGAAVKAFRAADAEKDLTGKPADDASIAKAAALATNGVDTSGDIFASPEYRAHLTRVYTRRALQSAVARAKSAA